MTIFSKKARHFNFTLLNDLWGHLNKNRRIQLILFLLLSLLGAFLEMISLGLALPFLMVLIDPGKLNEIFFIKSLISYLDIKEQKTLITILSFAFISTVIVAGISKILILTLTTRTALNIGKETCQKILKTSLFQPYIFHVNVDSNEITNSIISKVDHVVFSIILNVINFLSSIIFLIIIIITLILINFEITITILSLILISYALIVVLVRKNLYTHSEIISRNTTSILRLLNEASNGIKEILLNEKQKVVINNFKNIDNQLKNSQGSIHIIGAVPKYVIETIGLVTIISIAYFINLSNEKLIDHLPIIGVMVFAAQKSLPLAQQVFSAWSGLKGNQAALRDVLEFLNLEKNMIREHNFYKKPNFTFKKYIEFLDNKFSYRSTTTKVNFEFSLKIKKGEKIGIVGKSGSGKTTLIDIILQLLKTNSGKVKVDGKFIDNRKKTHLREISSYVSQRNFLSDTTILENVILNNKDDKIDFEKLDKILQITDLYEYIMKQENKYNSRVGEFGKKISGGQAQRIAIARALYKDPEILILDESTSALDLNAEKKILNNLLKISKNLTIIFVTHRINALEKFDKLLYLDDGKIVDSGTFEEIKNKYFMKF